MGFGGGSGGGLATGINLSSVDWGAEPGQGVAWASGSYCPDGPRGAPWAEPWALAAGRAAAWP